MKKTIINIVYAPQKDKDHKIFENKFGEIWHSSRREKGRHNVGMGWYSIRDPKPGDSLLVLEPYCILPRDYRSDFVKRFKYLFTWAVKVFDDPYIKRKKLVEINHPSCRDIKKRNIGSDWLPWNKRKNEIVFIANNKSSTHNSELYTFRIQLADLLHHSYVNENSKYRVSWYGNIPLKGKPYYRGSIANKNSLLKTVKFSVCTENSYHPKFTANYFTEKMPEVWNAGTVPIYIGCYNINKFKFPENSYIDLRHFTETKKNKTNLNIFSGKLIKRLNNFSENHYDVFKKKVINDVLTEDRLFHYISYERMYETMINTLRKGKK